MSRRAEYHLEARFVVTPELVESVRAQCSLSARTVWISTQERLTIHTLKGVPAKYIDILLPEYRPNDYGVTVCEIGLKNGSYDGNKRWRLAFRTWPTECLDGRTPSTRHPGKGSLTFEEEILEGQTSLIILARWSPGGVWAQSFPKLRYTLDNRTDYIGICIFHYKRYYSFLPEEDARQVSYLWANLEHTKKCDDIVVLNRTASAALYDLAVQLGWKKLTLKDKKRYGLDLDGPQWQRVNDISRKRNNISASGVGQFTLEAASGKVSVRAETKDSYGNIFTE